jgi:iron(III) transport system substrate-binding protein
LLLAVGLALTACGDDDDGGGSDSAANDVLEKYSGVAAADRRDDLLAAAKAEGNELVIYGSETSVLLGEAFEQEFGIEVEVFDTEPEAQLVRITQEANAGRHSFDITNNADSNLEVLSESGLLAAYESDLRSALPEGAQGEFWTGNRRQAYIVGYNTDRVNSADLPADYLGFADPKWAGESVMELGSVDWYAALNQYFVDERGMSKEDVDTAFARMAANSRTMRGQSAIAPMLAAGQIGVCLQCFVHHMQDQRDEEGAPVEMALVSPVFVRYDALGMSANAPHPAAAVLFIDWVLKQDGGVQVIIDDGRLPAGEFEGDPLADAEVYSVDLDDFLANREEWTQKYDELLRGQQEIPEPPDE